MISPSFPRVRLAAVVRQISPVNLSSNFSIALDSIEPWSGRLLSDPPEELETAGAAFEPGDILFGKLRPYLAKVWVADRPGIYIGDFIRLCSLPNFEPQFLGYALRTREFIAAASAESTGTKMPRTEWDRLRQLCIPAPPLHVQQLIVDYLDRETAEIDALRLETESLIHLAQERGNALSERLVWGCDAPMMRLKFIADILSGYPFKSEDFLDLSEDTIPLLRGINVSPQGVIWDSVVSLPSSQSRQFADYILKSGDLVLGLDRPLISSGLRLAEVEAPDAGSLLVQRVARIRSKDPSTSNKWLKVALRSSRFKAHLEPDFTGVSVPHMSPSQLSEFAIPIPPLEVQSEILAEVNAENDAVSDSVIDLQLLLGRLEERRSALISAAVTGQIDVTAQAVPAAEQLRDELEVHA
ncbi:restriction endonuclease subunit S [Corynebacterium pseudodiphtheriticum]|uniref:restriction endonuclease subunit S n=1 Tax=Corynebacterium pseudodiphtheriticum TaxID=37637 RepID=UPI00234D2336|nr:restriction endonuclease subunit S [Corynebacterium pseudodiphtheriticum]MDC7113047.1 restriction endonuclease subunit S [Corynebacterium pseudodiphtheriticum]MDK4277760.1 restriction endonuclease subunit S [Corynebacterium pseudodiphtheriticum]MDK8546318.1 restriction endonuclease subunit S [Corynebacterium pseudodiphtheriticum]MDK8709716.1 restriction endonuclease subunit S [Corynebacterium pseudodiphtheriticum]